MIFDALRKKLDVLLEAKQPIEMVRLKRLKTLV